MDNLGVQLELPGQAGEAQRVDAILTGDAPDDDASSASDEDGAEEDEESGPGTPQASGMVARRADD